MFDLVDTLADCLKAYADMIPAVTARADNMRLAAPAVSRPPRISLTISSVAACPSATLHEVVGRAVAHALEQDCDLADLSIETLRDFSDAITSDVYEILTVEGSVAAGTISAARPPLRSEQRSHAGAIALPRAADPRPDAGMIAPPIIAGIRSPS